MGLSFEEYSASLSEYLRLSFVVFLVFCVVTIVGIVWIIALYKRSVQSKQRHKKYKQNKKSKEFFELIAYFVLVVFLATVAIPAQAKNIIELRYDIENQAYIVYEGEFELQFKTEWRRGALPNGEYYLVVFENGTESITTQISRKMVEELALFDGKHSNITLVYAQKSHKIVDMYRKNN